MLGNSGPVPLKKLAFAARFRGAEREAVVSMMVTSLQRVQPCSALGAFAWPGQHVAQKP
jgi:hypothetical protein